MNSDKERFERVFKLLSERFVDDFVRGDLWNGYYQSEVNNILDKYNNSKKDILNQFKNKKIQTSYTNFNKSFVSLHRFLIDHFNIPKSHYGNGEASPLYYLKPEYHHNFFMTERGRAADLDEAERSKIWREFKSELERLSDEFHDSYKKFISTANSELDRQKPFWKRPEIIIPIILTTLGLIVAVISIPYWSVWFEKNNDEVMIKTPLIGPLTINSLSSAQVPNFATLDFGGDLVSLKGGEYNFVSYISNSGYEIPGYITLLSSSTTYSYSDFNADGSADIAATFVANNAGSGVFYFLAIFLNNSGFPEYTTAYYLGDRISVELVTASGSEMFVDIVTQGPDEPMCCASTPLSQKLSVYGNSINLVSEEWGEPETPSEESE